MDRLAEQFGDVALEVRMHVTEALRLAVERGLRMQVGIDVELRERLERDVQAPRVVEHRVMMERDPPRTGIEIQPGIELAALAKAAEFGVLVAAA